MFLLPIVLRLGLYRSLHTNRLPPAHLARRASIPSACSCGSSALPLTTLAEITALGFTGPIFVTIGAALFLGEDVRLRRWIAVIVGFVGAMIIIRPGFRRPPPRRHLHPGLHADLLGLEPDLQGAGAHRFGQHHRDLAEHRDRGLRRALRLWFWQTPSLDRPAVVRRGRRCAARWAISASSAATSSPTSRCCSRSASCR